MGGGGLVETRTQTVLQQQLKSERLSGCEKNTSRSRETEVVAKVGPFLSCSALRLACS